MKKALIPALAAVLVLVVSAGSEGGKLAPSVEAGPTDVFFITKSVCLALLTSARGGGAGADCLFGPNHWSNENNLKTIVDDLGDKDDVAEPEDFAQLDLDGNQIHEADGFAYIIAFVDDDDHTLFRVDAGGGTILASNGLKTSSEWICNTSGHDEDCDNDGQSGNGLIIAGLCAGSDDAICKAAGVTGGPAQRGAHTLRVQQEGFYIDVPYTVVGEPDKIEFAVLETVISTGVKDLNGDGDLGDPGECPLAADVAGFQRALAAPEKTVVLARVSDSDGTNITGAWVGWGTHDEDVGVFATALTPTLDLGAFGFGAPNVLCGTVKPGALKLRGETLRDSPVSGIDPNAEQEVTTVEVTVRGNPAEIALSVTPPEVHCDGKTSAEVAATVKDVDGNLVVNGTEVRFDVRVLGTANPIKTTTTDGVAKSKVTPLAVENTGVPVIVTAGNVQASTLVRCGAGAPAAAPPPAGPPPGAPSGAPAGVTRPPAVQPGLPRSGQSDLIQASALPWLAVGALGTLALALASGAIVARRRAR